MDPDALFGAHKTKSRKKIDELLKKTQSLIVKMLKAAKEKFHDNDCKSDG